MRRRWQWKRARWNQGIRWKRDQIEVRGGCSCISAPLFHLSCHCTQLPSHQAPSTKLCGTEHHCQAATSLPHQNILHCLHLQLCSSMFNRLSAPMVGYPRSRELIEAENPLHPCTLHPLASTCSSLALLAPLAIPPSPLVQSSLFNIFETPLGCLPPTDLAAHWKPRNENRIQ